MRSLIKPLLILLLVTNISSSYSQTTLGSGLLSITFDDKTVLSFFKDPIDKAPVRIIEFFNDKSTYNIKNLQQQQKWLRPEVLWLDYSPLVFREVASRAGWVKLIVNNSTGESYWVKKTSFMRLITWETFFKEMFQITRADHSNQTIKQLPSDAAKTIPYSGQDCFQVKSMKGDWIEIFTAEHCDDSYTKSKTKIRSGWIKWRDGNKLLVQYFITS